MPTYWCTNLLLLLFQHMKSNSKFKKIPPIILYSACLVTAAVTWKFSHLSHTLSPVATGHGKCMNLSQTISKNHWLLGTGYEWSWTWDCWLSRSIKHGQNPSRSCRSPVSTRMLLLQPAATEFGPGIAQERCVRSPNRGTNNNMWYRDLDPWTQKFTSEWMSLSMPRCYMLWWLWLTKLQGTEVVACLLCIWWVN